MAATASSRFPFPVGIRLKCSPTYVPTPPSYKLRFAARLLHRDCPVLCPVALPRSSDCPPRAPLHDCGNTALALNSWLRSAGVTPPSSLILAHAPDHHPPVGFGLPYSSRSLQVVASPCCMTALPDIISAILAQVPGSLPRHVQAVLSSVSSRLASASPFSQEDRLVN